MLHHFSEDPSIERFVPHVPPTNPTRSPAVWAIDEAHSPLYWFPRDCPRVTAWPRDDTEKRAFREAFGTTAARVHAIELGWLERVRCTTLYRYDFDPAPFRRLPDASGQWITESVIEPVAVREVGDLLALHATAAIELRLVPSLWPIHDRAISDQWDFSIVRMRNSQPRTM